MPARRAAETHSGHASADAAAGKDDRCSYAVVLARLETNSSRHPPPAQIACGSSHNSNAWTEDARVNRAGHFPAAPRARPGVRRRQPLCLSAVGGASTCSWDGLRAPVVTTAGPRGGAISEGAKNAAEAPHTATVSPIAGKINVCHRSAGGAAFFPRRLGARQSYHQCPYGPQRSH